VRASVATRHGIGQHGVGQHGVVREHRVALALACAAVLLRLPYLLAPEGSDEGGYLAVARQWHPGPSLYGHYWVDRPPLLVALFQLAAALGGLPALRVLGALCAAVAVLGVAEACRCVVGRRGAAAGAALAAALFASPQLGTVQVNGELLAAPFVAWSIALTLRALRPSPPTPGLAAFGAGAAAVAAVLVKQNMVEPLLFGLVAVLVERRTGALTRVAVRRIATAATAGAATALVLVGVWTVLHGTSLAGVFDATYPFRLRAAAVLATLRDQGQAHRADLLLHACLGSGVLLVVAVFLWTVLRRRAGAPVVWGVSVALAWACASIVLSGGFWDHYLVELVVPVAMAGGLLVGTLDPGTLGLRPSPWRPALVPVAAVGLVIVVALTHWAGGLSTRMSDRGAGVGAAIAAVASRRDTVVSAVGDAETVQTSGLRSPYPYLWTLPAQVDDPRLARLAGLLEGPAAPTWLVPWDRPSFSPSSQERLDAVVASRYRAVGVVCGHPVLLRDGIDRPSPPPEPCAGPVARW